MLGGKTFPILITIRGSHAYGMAAESSDIDIGGIYLAPVEDLLGITGNTKGEIKDKEVFVGLIKKLPNETYKERAYRNGIEGVCYELKKFLTLAMQCNPNMLEILFCKKADVVYSSHLGEDLRDFAHKFLSMRAISAYIGYAYQQLKRIETHRGWLFNPLKEKPSRLSFGLDEHKSELPPDQLKALGLIKEAELSNWVYPEKIEIVKQETAYISAKKNWDRYASWLENRNAERAELESKFGFDLKHASHLIRLLRSVKDLLRYGELEVFRWDADYLTEIRNGIYSYQEVMDEAELLLKDIKELGDVNHPKLPKEPDTEFINDWCIEVYNSWIRTWA